MCLDAERLERRAFSFSSRRRHTRWPRDWSSDVCSSDLDANWAFGTDFEDPLAGVDTTVPDGVDAADLGAYCLMLGDDALVLSQRISEWCASAPDLEEDIALANIALDLLGQIGRASCRERAERR